jgi:hypothetical protein
MISQMEAGVMRNLGLGARDVPAFEAAKEVRDPHAHMTRDAMVEWVHRITHRRHDGDKLALHNAIDDAHAIIKKASEKSGLKHAAFLSALADKALEEMNSADAEDSDAGDEGDGDVKNPEGDAGDLRSMQDMKTASPAPSPSPIDRTTGADSPRYLARHASSTAKVPGGGNLLLNVSQSEFNRARVGRV